MTEETFNGISFGKEFDKQAFGLIDDGKYEVVIEKAEEKTSVKGSKYLNITFRIRDDVDQNFKNRRLFYTIGKKENDACYDFGRVNKIILTQEGRADYKSRFDTFDEVLFYLNGLHLVVTVVTTFDDYRGEDRNEVKDFSFEPSLWDMQEHHSDNANNVVTNDDLPF